MARGDASEAATTELRNHIPPLIRYERLDLKDDDNAFAIWKDAIATFKTVEQFKPRNYIAPAELNFSIEEAEVWLDRNTNTLALLDQGIARQACQFPYPDQGYHTILPYLGELLSLADTKLLRAKVRIRKGQSEAATEDLVGLLKMSELVANANGSLIDVRCGCTIDRRVNDGITALLQSSKLDSRILQQLISATSFRQSPNNRLRDALRLEMECFLMFASEWPDNLTNATETEVVMGRPPKGMKLPQVADAAWTNRFAIYTGDGGVGYHKALLSGHPNALDKPATIGLFGAYLVHLTQQASLPVLLQQTNEPSAEMIACQKVEQFWNTIPAIRSNRTYFVHLKGNDLTEVQRGLAQIDNPVGKQIVFSRTRDIEHPTRYPSLSAVEQIAVWQLQREAMQTCIALRLYWERNNELPQDVSNLVENGILPALPLDPFTGNRLQYSKGKALVWSEGWKKIADDRGLGTLELRSAWAVHLPSKVSTR